MPVTAPPYCCYQGCRVCQALFTQVSSILAGNTVSSVRPLVPEFSFVLMKTCETLSAGDVIERPTSGDSEPHITTIQLEEYLSTPLIDVY